MKSIGGDVEIIMRPDFGLQLILAAEFRDDSCTESFRQRRQTIGRDEISNLENLACLAVEGADRNLGAAMRSAGVGIFLRAKADILLIRVHDLVIALEFICRRARPKREIGWKIRISWCSRQFADEVQIRLQFRRLRRLRHILTAAQRGKTKARRKTKNCVFASHTHIIPNSVLTAADCDSYSLTTNRIGSPISFRTSSSKPSDARSEYTLSLTSCLLAPSRYRVYQRGVLPIDDHPIQLFRTRVPQMIVRDHKRDRLSDSRDAKMQRQCQMHKPLR